MIEQTSFLGMPLKTQRQRRLLVVLYYALLVLLDLILLWRGKGSWVGPLIAQTLTFGGLLGGIRVGGPVKSYEEHKLATASGLQTLNLQGRRIFDTNSPLDERERTQRDHAHYIAYRIVYITLVVAVLPYLAGLGWAPRELNNAMPVLLWSFLIYVLSLPQSVLLWTEPQEPAGELAAMR